MRICFRSQILQVFEPCQIHLIYNTKYTLGGAMIKVTGLNKEEFSLNAEIIEKIEIVPETLITLINGKKYLVLESAEVVIDQILKYKKKIFTGEL